MTELLLPEGTRLLHIGPPKTGTTAFQYAFAHARPALAGHGVVYPGTWRQHGRAVRSLRAAQRLAEDADAPRESALMLAHWPTLVQQVAAAGEQRVVISSEGFAGFDTAQARLVIDRLGGPRVHVLVTLRPLSKIMPSAWQQYVRSGLSTSYGEWLDCMLNRAPYAEPTPGFWEKHHHDALIERWASIVGTQQVTVLIVDEQDPSLLTRTAEQLVGLPAGLLQPNRGRTNRSLTFGEIELVRQLNIEFARRGWPNSRYETLIQTGMNYHLQENRRPSPDEPKLLTPDWALEQAAQIGARSAEKLSALGVRIVGDLAALGARPQPSDGTPAEPGAPVMSVAVATEAVVGVTAAALSDEPSARDNPTPHQKLASISSKELARLLRERSDRRVRRTASRRREFTVPGVARTSALPVLPKGSLLLHIGPHKTGTTALQGALRESRQGMARNGVVYPGRGRQHWHAALAIAGGRGLKGQLPPSITDWDSLVDEVHGVPRDNRVILSSEAFCAADTDTARTIVDQLGGERIHVLVTLRPLSKIMPSAWQQYVRNGLRASYDDWLDGMLRKPPYNKPTPTFWQRHQHDVLVERWAAIVGPANLSVAILDDTDPRMLMKVVEELVGLPRGLLQPQPGRINRSLTLGEIELVRRLNGEFKSRGWSDDLYNSFVGVGMIEAIQRAHQPTPAEPRLTTPDWALERAAEIGAEAAEKITTCGVRVIGDLARLGSSRSPTASPSTVDPSLPVVAVTQAVAGAVGAGMLRLNDLSGDVSSVTSSQLIRVLARRVSARIIPALRRNPGENDWRNNLDDLR